MTTTTELIQRLQGVYFEMYLKGFIKEEEFNVLSNITEKMGENEFALEIAVKLNQNDLGNKDLVDCILANEFKTATLILE